jgi:hypothetical protein
LRPAALGGGEWFRALERGIEAGGVKNGKLAQRRGTRMPVMPVIRGDAPVRSDAKPGAVSDGNTAVTSSAKAPPR